jgi:hypothetical protein
VDGKVTAIDVAPAGGQFVYVNNTKHYVAPGFGLTVKLGDTVEAGDVISEGIPNPSKIVEHKGIGEGRRYFTDLFTKTYRETGQPVHRRNVELIARGLINHVEFDDIDEEENYLPGDTVPYNRVEKNWKPRPGTQRLKAKAALGMYLEKPVLHYSIGTPIRPSMLKDLTDFGVEEVEAHSAPPPWHPVMIRGMDNTMHDPDWMVRFLGSNQKRSLLSAVHRGGTSDTQGTSFVPALVEGLQFGRTWPQGVLKPPTLSKT